MGSDHPKILTDKTVAFPGGRGSFALFLFAELLGYGFVVGVVVLVVFVGEGGEAG